MKNSPVGFFDSGIGGTSIWKEVVELLPHESTIFLADSKNAPYGEKSKDQIIELSIKNTELLLSKGCKLIIVACNTATTNAIDYLRHHYDVPFIGIEPAIKPAALKTETGSVGILATKGTLSSELFNKTSAQFASDVEVIEQNGDGIVDLIESGKLNSDEMKTLLKKYIEPMLKKNIDYLVLGCTHYPYLIPLLKELLPSNVMIIDSGLAVAKQTENILSTLKLLNNSKEEASHLVFTNRDVELLKSFVQVNNSKVEYLDF